MQNKQTKNFGSSLLCGIFTTDQPGEFSRLLETGWVLLRGTEQFFLDNQLSHTSLTPGSKQYHNICNSITKLTKMLCRVLLIQTASKIAFRLLIINNLSSLQLQHTWYIPSRNTFNQWHTSDGFGSSGSNQRNAATTEDKQVTDNKYPSHKGLSVTINKMFCDMFL